VGIAAILPHLRLLIQQYFDIADYVGSPSINRGVATSCTELAVDAADRRLFHSRMDLGKKEFR
jgi:hypothetical protein